jgi:putative aldouronate transport system substrate-binding protein
MLLSACGGGATQSSPSATAGTATGTAASTSPAASTAADPHAEKVNIEVMRVGWNVATSMPKDQDNFVKKTLDEKLNIDLKLSLSSTAEEFIQKLNIRAAGNDLPDVIMFNGRNEYQEYVKKNILMDLGPLEEKLKPTVEAIGENTFSRVAVGGKHYAISLNPNANLQTFWIRKDWLDKLQLPVPKTLDDVFAVAKAFTEQDPDGNGKKDTIGITGNLQPLVNLINMQHGVQDAIYMKDGKLVNGLYEPEMKEALAYTQKVLNSGAIDPEIASNQGETAKDKAFQGKAGIIITDWTQVMKDNEVEKWKGASPNADFIMINELQGPKSDLMASVDLSYTSGILAISRKVAEDETKLNRILEMINYTASGEGADLVQFGVEGTHFTKDNGKTVLTDKASEAGFTWVYQFAGRPEADYLSTKFAKQIDYIKKNEQIKTMQTYNGFVTLPENYNAADADRFKAEEMLKFQYGKSKLDQYDKFIDKLNTTFKYKIYNDSAMQQLKDLGY